jgi:hypothetical protein
MSRAPHLQSQAVTTIIRFANARGNPEVPDGFGNVRSLVKFQLPDGNNADILANSVEGVPVRSPEAFLAFLRAQLPDPATDQPAPDAMPRFLWESSLCTGFIERLMQKPVFANYGQTSYRAEHAFGSPPRTVPVDSPAITGCPRRERPISPRTKRARATRASCAKSSRADAERPGSAPPRIAICR